VKRRIYIWSSLLGAVLLAWFAHRAWLAHQNLVTLDVRDADVRDVLRKCEWQTWETIVVHKDVKGKVTYTCYKVPLDEVLAAISEQTSTRISPVYPIFSKSSSFVSLRKLARGDIFRDTAGWTNFVMQGGGNDGGGRGGRGGGFGGGGFGGGGFGGPGGFGDGPRPPGSLVTLNVVGKDLEFAAQALARWSGAQVVPEDGAAAVVTLSLKQVPLAEAVTRVAKAAGRKSEMFYSVQAQPDFFADRGGEGFGGRDGEGRRGRGTNGFGFRGTNSFDTNRWAELREERETQRDAQRDRFEEIRLATMTPEEQAKMAEDQKKFEDIRNMPPEQRQAAFESMRNDPRNQQRFENRRMSYLNNSSPDQRAERGREIMERRARWESQGGQPGGRGRGR
jgi:hypothetical protein